MKSLNSLLPSEYKVTRHADGDADDLDWTISFSDVLVLLLIFFVMLISVSRVNSEVYEKIQKSFAGEVAPKSSLEFAMLDIQTTLQKHGLADQVVMTKADDGIKMIIRDSLLFASGNATISAESNAKLAPILLAFRELPEFYQFTIEGHTDDTPINSRAFDSNWSLASARAIAVLNLFLAERFHPNRISIRAFADTQPVAPNRDKDGNPIEENQTKNRRVVIRIR